MLLRRCFALLLVLAAFLGSCAAVAATDDVKITALGSHEGEFCARDRAMVLEDPNGLRILYDAGRTVAGSGDPRLGDIDVVLISHVHGDHLGDSRIAAVNQGTCAQPQTNVGTTPDSNSVEIAVGKEARIVVGSEMASFLSRKVEKLGGDPDSVQLVRFGASRTIDGVSFTTVPAVHSNGLSGDFIEGDLGESLSTAGLTAYVGPPTGYVITFSNGLVVYLSGDTGVTAEQETVVANQYGAKLVVINIGDTFTTGPKEAAYVINELIKPTAVIPSHANEAATRGGALLPDTRTAVFVAATETPVYLPLSGRTISFDADGLCTSGCSNP
ncbi:MBL fold metallo-hydrolase [Pseudanabaena sp. FACHB-2040]|uniref:MBL fold metallo-hydrolase n=1 Tax=Pseudanabaena sp. FACHB-2040 TaxID=2692859 RepID=UPI0016853CF3|nr:MBL fold metallo-hydrolase [Pseudanabaena sp. FACHB-2040]MBD2258534.1 MBL fold metallo-hydrolase [Pseudanabaena sp. FACHB-2040]